MAYSPTFWVNNSEPAITAEKLNKIEYGVASGHAIAESKASTDYVQGQVAAEVDARINYVDSMVSALESETNTQLDEVNTRVDQILIDPTSVIDSAVRSLIDEQVADPTTDTYSSIQSTSISAVDTEWSLNTLTTNIASSFGPNANNINSTIDERALTSADSEWSLTQLTTNLGATFGPNAANIDQAISTSVNENFSLSTLKTNLESQFGANAASIGTKLATYATGEDMGAIAQVALDVNGRITGWTAVDSSVGGSAFRINADTFALADSTNEHVPFAIDAATGVTQFNGIVQFSNVSGIDEAIANSVNTINTDLSSINTTISQQAIDIAAVDGRVDSEEQARINAINAEALARANAIQARINEDARLDGAISDEEQARIDSAAALTIAYQNYADTVKQALIDGEITQAEQNAINEAQSLVDTAKATLESQINALAKVEDISWQTEVQNVLDNNTTVIDGSRIVTGTILADRISTNSLSAISADLGTITSGVMYNTNGGPSDYTMKVDLANGEIHIR